MPWPEYLLGLLVLGLLVGAVMFSRDYLRHRAFLLATQVLNIRAGDIILIQGGSKLDEEEMAELYRLGHWLQRTHRNVIAVRVPPEYDIRQMNTEYMRLHGWVRAEQVVNPSSGSLPN
ncbi:hypothetical protein [Deinococcus cellulosilyticus]|uniref:Uncharacterized protein n=1 Tax=Deinococcus cellulosilyticus (strain DSM 18568 / NBRC 106333 / KACC 11606 / 5516J-15) TaxID=1223518 RepID=A0A511N847_DEIC1|nr:hypothetical protein [Deinococcus cellulosilyticus]GEM48658.1 hypothetical protein DC3_42930 [Deinococcus cellulosilyticus NBRC 106333 = KACC 11606]